MNYHNAREMRLLAEGSAQRIIADNKKKLLDAIRDEAAHGQTCIAFWNPKSHMNEFMACKCRFFYDSPIYEQYLMGLGFCIDRSQESAYVKVSWENA